RPREPALLPSRQVRGLDRAGHREGHRGAEEMNSTMQRRGDRMHDARGRRRVLAWLLVVAMFATGAMPALAAEQGVVRLEVTIGRAQVVELKEPFTRVSVTNPAVADVFVVTPNQLLVSGKAVGTTSLVVFYPRKTVFFDIFVQTDLALLRERLKHVAP